VSEHRQEGVKDRLVSTLPMQMRVCGCNLVLVRFNVLLITTPIHHSTDDQDHKPAVHQTRSSRLSLGLVCGVDRQWLGHQHTLSTREDRSVINILLSLVSTATWLGLTGPLIPQCLCSQTHATLHANTLQSIHRPRSHKHACFMRTFMKSVTRHKHWF